LKRRSATSSPPPEAVFFSDENLGTEVFPTAIRDAGIPLEVHADRFQQGTPDEEWLKAVAAQGWVLLTLDARLRYNRLERDTIMRHGLAAFVLVGGKTHGEKAETFLRAFSRVLRFLQRHPPPFIAKIYASGKVELWLEEEQWRRGAGRNPAY
jgi:PIN like domain